MRGTAGDIAAAPAGAVKGAAAVNWKLPFLAVLVVAALLRVYQLDAESLWIDEGFSLRDATVTYTFVKASRPLYYWLLSLWMNLGRDDWLLRTPAVIFGVATVAWLVLPVLASLAASLIVVNVWVSRYLMFVSPAFYLLLGAACARQRSKTTFLALAVFLVLLPVGKLVRHYQETTRPEWRLAVKHIVPRDRPGDTIAVYHEGNKYVFAHYYRGPARTIGLGPKVFPESEYLGWSEQKALRLLHCIPGTGRRWLVVSSIVENGRKAIGPALESHYLLLDQYEVRDISVYLFQERDRSSAVNNGRHVPS